MDIPTPRCTVRGCRLPLAARDRSWTCPAGHTFDVAREGYVNLLQPQDRRSTSPGDAPVTAAARRRWTDGGLVTPLVDLLDEWTPAGAVLDVGCGDGTVVGRLAAGGRAAVGLDLSPAALRLAARRHRDALFVAGNADRGLPFADDAFDAVLSVAARFPADEVLRVLRPGGVAIVAVAGADDLDGVRCLVLGEADSHDRLAGVIARIGAPERRARVAAAVELDADAVRDALLLTWRARHSAMARARAVRTTLSWEVACFRSERAPPVPTR